MLELSPDAWVALYGSTFLIMGVAIVARATAYPASSFRNRLLALGAFGVLQAAAQLVIAAYGIENVPPYYLGDTLYLPRSLALYYFAFGWSERRPMLAHAIALASVCGFFVMTSVVSDPDLSDILNRFGIAIPASFCAAMVFVCDRSFRFESKASDTTRWIVATAFMTYAMLQAFTASSDHFPASAFNVENLEALIGVPSRLVRGLAILVIGAGTIALLNRFGTVMREQAELRISRAQSEAQTVDKKLQNALQISGLGSLDWFIDTGEVRWSDQTYKLFGMTPGAMDATFATYLKCVHPGDRVLVKNAIRRLLERGGPQAINHRIVWPDGTGRYVQSHGEAEAGPDGKLCRVFGAINDVTDLVEARIKAEEASAAKTNFIANMSHELRTPLNAILGFSEMMEKEIYGPLGDLRYRNYAADVHKSGQHLLSVISDILNISRIDSGKAKLKEEEVDIRKLLSKCTGWVGGLASGAGIGLRTSIASGLPALRGDPRLLTQIMLNLLSNAVKFTPHGGSIEITAKETAAGGVAIAIQDTGIGMTPDQTSRIGEPFLQFDDITSRKYDGTGLGLSIVKRLVELHGGELEVQSTTGVGTRMSINMPPERFVRKTLTETQVA